MIWNNFSNRLIECRVIFCWCGWYIWIWMYLEYKDNIRFDFYLSVINVFKVWLLENVFFYEIIVGV